MLYADVVLLSPPYSILTYSLPDCFPDDFWRSGLRVAVPLGRGANAALRCGYIDAVKTASGLPPRISCRQICWPLECGPMLGEELTSLARDLARRQGFEIGRVYGNILPAGLRETDRKLVWQDQTLSLRQAAALEQGAKAALARDFLQGLATFAAGQNRLRQNEVYVLRVDPPWPLRPAAKKQMAVLDFLHERPAASRKDICASLGAQTGKIIDKLLQLGYLAHMAAGEEENLLPPPVAGKFRLNEEQRLAADDLAGALSSGLPQCRLLFGITGSGKTAVYLELAQLSLAAGKSVFLLAPEVALACKLRRDVSLALPEAPVCLYHGYQQPAAREKTFRMLASQKKPCIVVGTRSALFLPLHNPGCVILDEEHDGSFKQDESFAYHAKEVAWFRMQHDKGLLVLGSATPDLKTFHASREGRLPMLSLRRRVSGNALPQVEFVDIGQNASALASEAGAGLLSPYCEDALLECRARGEQAVILLNRRGYAPMIYCVNCARILRCPHCEIGLAYHKSMQKLSCHYCGYSLPYPSPCPDCGKTNFLAVGEGTERLAERLEVLAGQPVLRLDRDSVRRQGRLEEILGAFRNNESPFLVGTQMLSKGHHFPNVTLALIADGDIGLNLPDYRAAERTFQLLVQSSGRAGRGEKPGRVLIQTRDANHYCWKYIAAADYEGFYEEELARRKKRLYPPFTHLALLRISFPQADAAGPAALRELAQSLKEKCAGLGVTMLGPASAPIAMLRGMRRFQCLFKSQDWALLRQVYFFASQRPCAARLRLFLDLDPVNML